MTGKLICAGEATATKAARVPFLIGTPKRLKIAVTHRKQSPRPIPNRYKISGSSVRENRDVRRADILFTLSLEGPAVLTVHRRTQFATPNDHRPSATFTSVQQFCNCFLTRILIRIRSGPLQEFTRFEEEQ